MSRLPDTRRPQGPSAGVAQFARYAYPPNALGYCGPPGAADRLRDGPDAADPVAARRLAASFDGAWPYLELIARHNGIAEPLDPDVVEAYWIGNHLLDAVPDEDLTSWADEPFFRAGPVGGQRAGFPGAGTRFPVGAVPHHNLHVFAVYPWLNLLRSGRTQPSLAVLDQCRIRWGTVEEVDGGAVKVCGHALAFDGWRLTLGERRLENVRWDPSAAQPGELLAPGDSVSLHWDWVCDRLTASGLAHLQACTTRNLAAVNSMLPN